MGKEMTLQARKRRLQDTLIIAGAGVIAFSVWGIAKAMLLFAFSDESQLRQMLAIDDSIPMAVIFIITVVMVVIDWIVRAYVGLSARSEGRGKKKSPFYLIVAAIAALVNAFSVVTVLLGTARSLSFADAVVSFVIEATAFVALVMVIYCSVRLRRLGKATG